MEKAWRVSISNHAQGCYNCDDQDLGAKRLTAIHASGDYCPSCQHVTVDYVDRRSDYADQTVGYYDSEGAAKVAAEKLTPME